MLRTIFRLKKLFPDPCVLLMSLVPPQVAVRSHSIDTLNIEWTITYQCLRFVWRNAPVLSTVVARQAEGRRIYLVNPTGLEPVASTVSTCTN